MFKQRLLTTLILVPLVLLSIYYASTWFLGGLVLLITALMGWEWLQLIPSKRLVNSARHPEHSARHPEQSEGSPASAQYSAKAGRSLTAFGMTWGVTRLINKIMFVVVVLLLVWPAIHWLNYWLVADLVLWALILIAVLTFPASQAIWGRPVIVGVAGLLLLPIVASTICALYLQIQGKDLIVYLLCLIWASDIGAYLAGKQWGHHKLIPAVSPGKTIEGSLGGIVLTLLVAGIGYIYFKPHYATFWFIIAVLTGFISMLGDLFISMLKRRSQLKDTGNIFPGHGGVLDRLDSLIAALPLFYFAYTISYISQGL